MKCPGLVPMFVAPVLILVGCADGPAAPEPPSAPDFAVGQPSGTWVTLTPVPTAFSFSSGVEGMSVASVGDTIVAALGYDLGDRSTTRLYDIASDAWSFGAGAPGSSSEGAGTSHGGLFYNVGGRGPFGSRTDIWAYDPTTNTWNAGLALMSVGRTGLAVAVVGNAIYAIGGRSATGGPCSGGGFAELSSVERYDVLTDTWTPVASLPAPRSDLAAAVVGGKIYVFGGCRGSGTILADVDVYDPVTDTWSGLPTDMPTPRAGLYAIARHGGTIQVIGGWDGIGAGLSTNESYKVAQDVWTSGLPPMPTARAEAGAADHGGKIYIVGGATPGFGASVAAMEAFKP